MKYMYNNNKIHKVTYSSVMQLRRREEIEINEEREVKMFNRDFFFRTKKYKINEKKTKVLQRADFVYMSL